MCEAYGVWVEKSMYGRKYMGAQRATFVIDGEGIVRHVIPKAKPKTHDDEVLAALAVLAIGLGADVDVDDLRRVPEAVEKLIAEPGDLEAVVEGLLDKQGVVVSGRGMAFSTALETAPGTRWSKGPGMTKSSRRSSPTSSARALAAASFMPSVIAVACTSSAPRKMPGNASTLLIWLGKS